MPCPIVQAIRLHARKSPESLAYVYRGKVTTYAELDRITTHLAAVLSQTVPAAATTTRVGLLGDNKQEVFFALIACLKAGFSFCPMEVRLPPDTLHHMVEHVGIEVVIDCHHGDLPPPILGAMSDCKIQTMGDLLAQECPGGGFGSIPETEEAYVLYTSGSTSKTPKAITQTRWGWATHAGAGFSDLGLQEIKGQGVIANLPNCAHDHGLFNVGIALLFGFQVVDIDIDQHPKAWVERTRLALETYQVNILSGLSSVIRLLFQGYERGRSLSHLLRIITGGAAMKFQDVLTFISYGPDAEGAQLVTTYGLSEVTWGSCYSLTRPLYNIGSLQMNGIPLGKLTDGLVARIYPVEGEEGGELWLSGPVVRRCYVDETLNEQFFVVDGDTTWYRTGDLVRVDPETGMYWHLGRLAHLAKVDGNRVNPLSVTAEIERKVPAIEAAVVMGVALEGGNERLVCFYRLKPGYDSVDTLKRRNQLKAVLPAHAIPSEWFSLEDFPLLPNQKVNKRAMLEIYQKSKAKEQRASQQAEFPVKLDDPEAMRAYLLRVWARTLGVSEIVGDTNFFAHGGTSLVAMQMLRQIQQDASRQIDSSAVERLPGVQDLQLSPSFQQFLDILYVSVYCLSLGDTATSVYKAFTIYGVLLSYVCGKAVEIDQSDILLAPEESSHLCRVISIYGAVATGLRNRQVALASELVSVKELIAGLTKPVLKPESVRSQATVLIMILNAIQNRVLIASGRSYVNPAYWIEPNGLDGVLQELYTLSLTQRDLERLITHYNQKLGCTILLANSRAEFRDHVKKALESGRERTGICFPKTDGSVWGHITPTILFQQPSGEVYLFVFASMGRPVSTISSQLDVFELMAKHFPRIQVFYDSFGRQEDGVSCQVDALCCLLICLQVNHLFERIEMGEPGSGLCTAPPEVYALSQRYDFKSPPLTAKLDMPGSNNFLWRDLHGKTLAEVMSGSRQATSLMSINGWLAGDVINDVEVPAFLYHQAVYFWRVLTGLPKEADTVEAQRLLGRAEPGIFRLFQPVVQKPVTPTVSQITLCVCDVTRDRDIVKITIAYNASVKDLKTELRKREALKPGSGAFFLYGGKRLDNSDRLDKLADCDGSMLSLIRPPRAESTAPGSGGPS